MMRASAAGGQRDMQNEGAQVQERNMHIIENRRGLGEGVCPDQVAPDLGNAAYLELADLELQVGDVLGMETGPGPKRL